MPGSMSMSDHLQIIGRRRINLKSVPVIWTEIGGAVNMHCVCVYRYPHLSNFKIIM